MGKTMTVHDYLDLPNEDFRDLVDEEVRGITDEAISRALRDPVLMERWYLTLVQMKKSVESQLGAKRSDLVRHIGARDYPSRVAEYHRWRAGSLRFKSGVEERLLEVRAMRFKGVTNPWKRTQRLLDAIIEHRDSMGDYNEEGSEADLRLWRLAEEYTAPPPPSDGDGHGNGNGHKPAEPDDDGYGY